LGGCPIRLKAGRLMTEDTFKKAILADLDDDVIRLVYADWLEENGSEKDRARAALIRAQCEVEHAPRERRAELNREAKAILSANPDWTDEVVKSELGRKPLFRRGFLHHLTMGATQFVRSAEKIFEAFPTVRAVRFHEASNEVKKLAKCPLLARLSEADLSNLCSCGGCHIENDIKALIASPFVGNLVKLNIAGNRIDSAQAEALAVSTAFGQLRELNLSNNEIGDDGAKAFMASPWMGQLQRLKLRGNGLGAPMTKTLRKHFGKAVIL
jgi:uncharacterized protein (TIGR02996 family)